MEQPLKTPSTGSMTLIDNSAWSDHHGWSLGSGQRMIEYLEIALMLPKFIFF